MKSTIQSRRAADDLISRLREDDDLRRRVARMLEHDLSKRQSKTKVVKDVGRLRR